ncbi:956_t:CDS:2, partial [Ambispora leptoticha]
WCGADPSPLLKVDSTDKQVLEFKNFFGTMNTNEKKEIHEYKTTASSSDIEENSQPSYIPNFLPSLPDGCPAKRSEFESDVNSNAKKEKDLTQKKRNAELSYCTVNPEETICAFSSYGLLGDDTETSMPELSDSELFVLKPITSKFEKIRISYSSNTLSRQNSSRISRRVLPILSDELPPNLLSRIRKRSRKNLDETEESTVPNIKKAKTEKAGNILLTPKKKAATIKTVKPKPTKNTSTPSTKTANEIAKQLPPPLPDNNTESK